VRRDGDGNGECLVGLPLFQTLKTRTRAQMGRGLEVDVGDRKAVTFGKRARPSVSLLSLPFFLSFFQLGVFCGIILNSFGFPSLPLPAHSPGSFVSVKGPPSKVS